MMLSKVDVLLKPEDDVYDVVHDVEVDGADW